MKYNIKKKAFTLIELLIVIAIIGILFVVLVSKVDFATDKAKATGVQTDFRSFQMAFETVLRENAGFASLGWDTGDENGNRKRDSYDEGDVNKNGIMDSAETWTGHKVPGENWTGTYTLLNPKEADDTSAFKLLEDKINANLDPKLHITIAPDVGENGKLTGNAKVTMANAAKDPWKNEYHGVYITNALNDKMDRGAIVVYSNGANGKMGCTQEIANGIVTVSVPGNNVLGQDDMSIVVCYSYTNGYGEVQTNSYGFASSNKPSVNSNNESVVTPSPEDCRHTDANNDNICDKCGQLLVIVGSNFDAEYNEDLGRWEITEDFVYDSDLPADNVITFFGGKFESAFYYNNATYDTIEYTIQETKMKYPSSYSGLAILGVADVTDISYCDCDYVLMHMVSDYEFVTGSTIIKSPAFTTYKYMLSENQTLENIIYLAAYLKNYLKESGDFIVAQWDYAQGCYIPIDCSAEISAINNFTYTTTRTVTEQVLLTPAEKVENLVFVPLGDMQADEGMTWREWLSSSYNRTGFTNTVIRNADGSVVSLDSIIEAGQHYSVYDAPKTILHEGGVYQTGSNYTVQVTTWEELLNSGLVSVTDGVLMGSQNISGDLIIPDGVGIVEIHWDAFEKSKLTAVSIPSSVKKIGANAFQNCESLVSVELNEGLEWMGSIVFKGCKALEGLTLPDSLVSWNHAGGNEFLGCNSMTYFHLGSGLTEVPGICGNFDTVIIPEGYLDMARPAFVTCTKLYVPKSIVTAGSKPGAFGAVNGWNAETIYYAGTEEEWNSIENIQYVAYENIVFNASYNP